MHQVGDQPRLYYDARSSNHQDEFILSIHFYCTSRILPWRQSQDIQKTDTLILDKSIRKISGFPANKEFITESTTAHRLILSRTCCIKSTLSSNSVAYVLPENHSLTQFHNGTASCGRANCSCSPHLMFAPAEDASSRDDRKIIEWLLAS